MKADKIRTRLKVNDNVVVISGTESGKRGKILKIDNVRGKIIVEGINKRNKYFKANQEHPKGGMVNIEFPISISNVMIFCEKCKKPTRVAVEVKDSNKIRVCRKCGKSLDK